MYFTCFKKNLKFFLSQNLTIIGAIAASLSFLAKSQAAQIYTYNDDNFNPNENIYYDPTITETNNKCLSGLIKRLPQKGDKEATEACLNTFGYNPDTNIKSPVMIVFEVKKTSQLVTTTIIYRSKNQIIKEQFQSIGARYEEWHPPAGMYTLDYIQYDNSASFKPAYANFYSPAGKKDKHGHPVNIGFHGRESNLMAGGGSNGCYRHRVADMRRLMTIINSVGKEAKLPAQWYKNTLPIAMIFN